MDNAYKLYQDLFSNYDSDIEIMEKSFSIIVSKVNDSIESVIFGKLGKLVGGMLHRDSPK